MRKFTCPATLCNAPPEKLLKQVCIREWSQFNKETNTYDCKYCDKKYKTSAGKSYHNKRCKARKAAKEDTQDATTTVAVTPVEAPTPTPIPHPAQKHKRTPIPKPLRIAVWNKHIGLEVGKAKCPCCKTVDVYQIDFECAHIEASAKGGATSLDNLIPVCFACNRSMGTTNLNDFRRHFMSEVDLS